MWGECDWLRWARRHADAVCAQTTPLRAPRRLRAVCAPSQRGRAPSQRGPAAAMAGAPWPEHLMLPPQQTVAPEADWERAAAPALTLLERADRARGRPDAQQSKRLADSLQLGSLEEDAAAAGALHL